MRLLKRSRVQSQVNRMRTFMLELLINNAAAVGSETKLAYAEVQAVMDYLDTFWLANTTILYAFIDARSIAVEAYETTGTRAEPWLARSYSRASVRGDISLSLSLPPSPRTPTPARFSQTTSSKACGGGLMVSCDPRIQLVRERPGS